MNQKTQVEKATEYLRLLRQGESFDSLSFWEIKNNWRKSITWDCEEGKYYISGYGHTGYATNGSKSQPREINEKEALNIIIKHIEELN